MGGLDRKSMAAQKLSPLDAPGRAQSFTGPRRGSRGKIAVSPIDNPDERRAGNGRLPLIIGDLCLILTPTYLLLGRRVRSARIAVLFRLGDRERPGDFQHDI